MNTATIIVLALSAALAGCDWGAASASLLPQKDAISLSEPGMDSARGRQWTLARDGVDLHDAKSGRKLAHVVLPGWLWVEEQFNCLPAIAIGPGGEAVITSNVAPILWRVDPATLAASMHELVLDQDNGRDIGFTGLAYSAEQGAFFAVSASQGSLWRIDPLLRRAQSISLSAAVPKACALSIRPRAAGQRANRFAALCVQADSQDWVINLSPDQRSGSTMPGECKAQWKMGEPG